MSDNDMSDDALYYWLGQPKPTNNVTSSDVWREAVRRHKAILRQRKDYEADLEKEIGTLRQKNIRLHSICEEQESIIEKMYDDLKDNPWQLLESYQLRTILRVFSGEEITGAGLLVLNVEAELERRKAK